MKKIIAVICTSIAVSISALTLIPRAVESSVPAAKTLSAEVRQYCETASGSGAFCFTGQREITSSLPLVIENFSVKQGDYINVGDELCTVDRQSSAALIESLGNVRMLAVPAADIETAIALLPEKIFSDCAGRIVSLAPTGSAVRSGSSIAAVCESEELSVTVAISELDIAKVTPGQKAQITAAAYPDEIFSGTVTDIAETARNQYSGSVLETVVDVTITPDVFDERLKPGLSADVEIELGEPREICVVPYSAIGQDERGEFVFVYDNGISTRRDIQTGAEFADGCEVVSGISIDDIILSEPEIIKGESYIRIV